MRISEKRTAGNILGRGGISQRIIQIATEISKGTYKEAIGKAGRIAELVDAATFDDYWDGKAKSGRFEEQCLLGRLVRCEIKRDAVICEVDPST